MSFVKENYESLKKHKKSTDWFVIPSPALHFPANLSKEPGTLHLGKLKDLYEGAKLKYQGCGCGIQEEIDKEDRKNKIKGKRT